MTAILFIMKAAGDYFLTFHVQKNQLTLIKAQQNAIKCNKGWAGELQNLQAVAV